MAARDRSVMQPKGLMYWPVSVNLYTDVTLHSVAAIVPSMRTSVAQTFVCTEEINRAEAIAAILGLTWACGEEFRNNEQSQHVRAIEDVEDSSETPVEAWVDETTPRLQHDTEVLDDTGFKEGVPCTVRSFQISKREETTNEATWKEAVSNFLRVRIY